MRITIATPLYPPDVEPTAVYIKELARRLATVGHTVTVVTYGRLPEPTPRVTMVAIDKRQPLMTRLRQFARALTDAARTTDVLYIENGPSVELPALLVPKKTKFIFHLGDPSAHQYAQTRPLRKFIENRIMARSRAIIADSPLVKPEILPFKEAPDLSAYETSWSAHLDTLIHAFTN